MTLVIREMIPVMFRMVSSISILLPVRAGRIDPLNILLDIAIRFYKISIDSPRTIAVSAPPGPHPNRWHPADGGPDTPSGKNVYIVSSRCNNAKRGEGAGARS